MVLIGEGRDHVLGVTARCLRDDLSGLNDPLIRVFAERRGEDPEGTERIQNLVGVVTPPVFSLHHGKARAATWFDQVEGIVWLLAVAPDHDYQRFPRLARRRELFPEPSDYDDYIEGFIGLGRELEDAQSLVREAESRVGQVIEGLLDDVIGVRVCLESSDPAVVSVAVSARIVNSPRRLQPQWQFMAAAMFLDGEPISTDTVDATSVRADELALRGPARVVEGRLTVWRVQLWGEP